MLVLPVPPDLVNHSMVHEEQGVVRGPFWSSHALWWSSIVGAVAGHVTSKNDVGADVSAVDSFEVGLETDEITLEAAGEEIHIRLGHTGVGQVITLRRGSIGISGERRNSEGVGEWEDREVPPDVVSVGVGPDEVFEAAGVDLIIVVGITPTANP